MCVCIYIYKFQVKSFLNRKNEKSSQPSIPKNQGLRLIQIMKLKKENYKKKKIKKNKNKNRSLEAQPEGVITNL